VPLDYFLGCLLDRTDVHINTMKGTQGSIRTLSGRHEQGESYVCSLIDEYKMTTKVYFSPPPRAFDRVKKGGV